MTKMQKLERSTKRGKLISIFSIIIFTIIFGILILNEGKEETIQTEETIRTVALIILKVISVIMIILVDITIWVVYKSVKHQNEYWIENERLKENIPKEYSLTTDSFAEICLKHEEKEDLYKKKIRKKLGAKYYAKLISKDEIEVVLKDKEGDLIAEPRKITDFHCFKNNYEPM